MIPEKKFTFVFIIKQDFFRVTGVQILFCNEAFMNFTHNLSLEISRMVLRSAILSKNVSKLEMAKHQNFGKMKKIVLSKDDKIRKEPIRVQFLKYAPAGI